MAVSIDYIQQTIQQYENRIGELKRKYHDEKINMINDIFFDDSGGMNSSAKEAFDFVKIIINKVQNGSLWAYYKDMRVNDNQVLLPKKQAEELLNKWQSFLQEILNFLSLKNGGLYTEEQIKGLIRNFDALQQFCDMLATNIQHFSGAGSDNVIIGQIAEAQSQRNFLLLMTGLLAALRGDAFELFVVQTLRSVLAISQGDQGVKLLPVHTGSITLDGKAIKEDIMVFDIIDLNTNEKVAKLDQQGNLLIRNKNGKYVQVSTEKINLDNTTYTELQSQAIGISAKTAQHRTTFHGGYQAQERLAALHKKDNDSQKDNINNTVMMNSENYKTYTRYLLSKDLSYIIGDNIVYFATPNEGLLPVADYLQKIADSNKPAYFLRERQEKAPQNLTSGITEVATWWPKSASIDGYAFSKMK